MFRPVPIDLYVVHGSHPCAAVERALEMKGLAFRRIELPPPLWPAEERARALVERAEEWGDEVWQQVARRLLWGALRRDPAALVSYSRGSRLPFPAPVIRAIASSIAWGERRLNHVTDGAVRADLRALPRHLDRIDGWIADGVLGGATPNAGDLQIATCSRLLLTIGDVAPFFAGRPAESHARRYFAPQAGETPRGLFDPHWLAGSPAAPAGQR